MTAVPWRAAVAGAAVALLGLLGLARGAADPAPEVARAAIEIVNAYVREPANLDEAAAYFTVRNNTDRDDTLVGVASGAGRMATLHTGSPMRPAPDGLPVPARGVLALAPGQAHVMIEKLFGPVRPGETVNLELTFANSGVHVVAARVIAITDPVPSGVAS